MVADGILFREKGKGKRRRQRIPKRDLVGGLKVKSNELRVASIGYNARAAPKWNGGTKDAADLLSILWPSGPWRAIAILRRRFSATERVRSERSCIDCRR